MLYHAKASVEAVRTHTHDRAFWQAPVDRYDLSVDVREKQP